MRLLWLALLVLCGCFDHGDGVVAGSGGAGDGGNGGNAGFAGVGGSFEFGGMGGGAGVGFFDGGFGGFGGSFAPPCPFEDANCNEDRRLAVCEELIECSTVAGPQLFVENCLAEIGPGCVRCVRELGAAASDGSDGGLTDDGGAAERAACDDAFEGSECDDFCDLLVPSPQSSFECETLARGELILPPTDAQCICANCFSQLEQCVLDDGCWLIAQCSARTGCVGSACFTEETCLPVIDAVGATSIGASLVSQLAECTSTFCATLTD